MAKKITTPAKKLKINNVDRLENVIRLAKEGKFKTKEFRTQFEHLKRVLSPTFKGTLIKEILDLHIGGYSNKEIVDMGYNKSTVNKQVKEYKTKTTFAISYQPGDESEDEE